MLTNEFISLCHLLLIDYLNNLKCVGLRWNQHHLEMQKASLQSVIVTKDMKIAALKEEYRAQAELCIQLDNALTDAEERHYNLLEEQLRGSNNGTGFDIDKYF